MVSVRCCDPSFKITFLASAQASARLRGRAEDRWTRCSELSSEVVRDRLGSLNYHSPDHPTETRRPVYHLQLRIHVGRERSYFPLLLRHRDTPSAIAKFKFRARPFFW